MKRSTGIVAGGVIALLVLGWSARFRVAHDLVDRHFAAARVPASYRITRIGPFLERLEDVRIGDPAAPDLVARRIDVTIGYRFGWPEVRAVHAEGVRLAARIDADGLNLGAIDRLMPASGGGGAMLPDLGVTLRDVRLALATPNGALDVALDGDGNPRRLFRGKARVAAATLRLASCRLDAVTADLGLDVRAGAPGVTGPVKAGQVRSPHLQLGRGTAMIAARSDATFRDVAIGGSLDGFGGHVGSVRFDALGGRAKAVGRLGALDVASGLIVRGLALPAVAKLVPADAILFPGTPVGPTITRARGAIVDLLGHADARADLGIAIRGEAVDVHVHRATLVGRDGARLVATERGGLRWSDASWRADGDVVAAGGGLPTLAVSLRQAAPGAMLTATGRMQPYWAGEAMLAISPLRATWGRAGLGLDSVVRIDGPIAGGAVRGLTLPIRGRMTPAGAIAIGQGCQPLAMQSLRLASFAFGPVRAQVCGGPIVAKAVGGALRLDAATGPLRLTGRTSGGAPVSLAASALRLDERHFTLEGLDAGIGEPDRETRLIAQALDGALGARGIEGHFAQASGRIANVPLDLREAAGTWGLAGGVLTLDGAMQVADADPSPRFLPLAADAVALRLEGSRITARGDLLEPKSRALVARVDLDHDLGRGSGQARLAVPGIAFAPKTLQPEALTPLTLGVIANVAGTIAGEGRIAWDANGVTSGGTFSTDRIDLAAAFGPVTGIKGTLRFTDLLGLVSAPDQEATIVEINPGVAVSNGVVHYRLAGNNRVQVQDAEWPFAGGTLKLEPSLLDFGKDAERRLTFRIDRLDAAAFVQQLDFPNIAATGTFDGVLPMVFDQSGGRIEGGAITARAGGGSLAYVGELSNAQLGMMGKMAFDALKAIRYSALTIGLDGRLDGEMISRVRFTGVREATPEQSLVTRLIRNLPFRFNIEIRAPFRGLVGSARAYIDPRLLLNQVQPPTPVVPAQPAPSSTAAPAPVQPSASGVVR